MNSQRDNVKDAIRGALMAHPAIEDEGTAQDADLIACVADSVFEALGISEQEQDLPAGRKIKYRAVRFWKYWEEDVYNDGCIPNSGGSWGDRLKLEADSLPALIEAVKKHLYIDCDDYCLDFLEEDGRIDLAQMEDAEATLATPAQMNAWKAGKLKLYSALYAIYVEKIAILPIMSAELEKTAH